MREFTFILNDELLTGVRRDARLELNVPGASVMYDLLPTPDGLEGISFKDLQVNGAELEWPYTRAFIKGQMQLLLGKDKVWELDTFVDPWEATERELFKSSDILAPATISVGSPWQFMSTGYAWFAFNGESVVFQTNLNSPSDWIHAKVLVNDSAKIIAGDAHNGRFVFAVSDWGELQSVIDSVWASTVDAWRAREINVDSLVVWTGIGNTSVLDAILRGTEFDLMESLRRGEWGFMPLDSRGKILHIRGLNQGVVVYSDREVAVLVPIETDPVASTYGRRTLLRRGIQSRTVVVGDDEGHVFIDESGTWWNLDSQLQRARLGYEQLDLGSVHVGFVDTDSRSYYLFGDKGTAVFNRHGMGLLRVAASTMVYLDGELLISPGGIHGEHMLTYGQEKDLPVVYREEDFPAVVEEAGLNGCYFESNWFDMQQRGLKRITQLNIAYRGGGEVQANVFFRYGLDESVHKVGWRPVNREGNATFHATGLEFKVGVRSENKDLKLDAIYVKWQRSDKRQIRGPAPAQAEF